MGRSGSTAARCWGANPRRSPRAGIAHVPQGRGTLADLTVDENLRLGAYARRDREVVADMERWYSTFTGSPTGGISRRGA